MRSSSVVRGLIPLVAVVFAQGCSLLIPDNPSEPRYNKVIGERHAPLNNPGGRSGGVAPQSRASSPAPVVAQQAAPVPEPIIQQTPVEQMPVAMSDLPPVSPQTQQIAQERLRSMPEENIVLASGDYPLLNDVPPTPQLTGEGATSERLAKVREQLERDRASAVATETKLKNDAAAEPSMLSDLPPTQGVAPAPAPVATKPVPPPAAPVMRPPVAPTSSIRVPPIPADRGIAALPPPPPMMDRTPVAAGPAPIQMDALPMAQASLPTSTGPEPIQLRPPQSMASGPDSFNPMAGSAPITLTPPPSQFASTSYLPSSRYAYRR